IWRFWQHRALQLFSLVPTPLASRHSLTFDMAKAVCEQLETIMATREQVEHAYNKSMQTCR
uniref:Link domain-containing protein n=1 Tax=Cyprinodon variegatus TaxID=28743 RepID=A0A3Q2CND6_CYPVA